MRRRTRRADSRPQSSTKIGSLEIEPQIEHAPSGELDRLIYLSDGVFAIAMTLLAVSLVLPEATSGNTADLGQRLLSLGPRYLSYALSFLVIASYWRSHQKTLRYVVRLDSRFVWMNLLLLLCIAFQPFPTSVLGSYSNDVAAVTLYAGTLAVTGVVVLGMWLYATVGWRLIRRDVSPRVVQHYVVRAICVPLIFLISIGIAQFDTNVAKYSWIAIAVVTNALGWLYRDTR
jgi:uncharacterized membrane protein